MNVLHLDLREDATRGALLQALLDALPEEKRANVQAVSAAFEADGRHFHDVEDVGGAIESSGLSDRAKEHAREIYRILAEAEACVHGCAVEDAHFHEVGSSSHVGTVLAMCAAVDELAPEEIVATPVQTGSGTVECSHGVLGIPAPATAAILSRGIPVVARKREGEWCTPTSAAVILHYVDRFEQRP